MTLPHLNNVLTRLKALIEYLEQRGRHHEARAVKRAISKLRYRRFPDRPDVGFGRFVAAYEDARCGVNNDETERARHRGTPGDPTARAVMREYTLDEIDGELEVIFEEHYKTAKDMMGKKERPRTHVWRDDQYAEGTNKETRERYA